MPCGRPIARGARRQWNEFSIGFLNALNNNSPDPLSDVGERYPNAQAGLWADQVAGDLYLERGLSEQLTDRDAAQRSIEHARDKYESIVNSSIDKSNLLYQQAKYSLAYATEVLGDYAVANEMYSELLKDQPKTPFASLIRRGQTRCKLGKETEFHKSFRDYDFEVSTPAPGNALPELPDIRLAIPPEELNQQTPPGKGSGAQGAPAEKMTTSPPPIPPADTVSPPVDTVPPVQKVPATDKSTDKNAAPPADKNAAPPADNATPPKTDDPAPAPPSGDSTTDQKQSDGDGG